jgi:MATE family multidrug resistance protein
MTRATADGADGSEKVESALELEKARAPERHSRASVLTELRSTTLSSLPVVGLNLAVFATSLFPQAMIGNRCEASKLAACALAISFSNVTGLSLTVGLSVSLETLVAQANGANQFRKCGVFLQNAIVIESAAIALVSALYSLGEHLFLAIGQEPSVARLAGQYLLANIPNIVGVALLNVVMRFLFAQDIFAPLFFVAAAGLGLQVITTAPLMDVAGWLGAPVAAAIGSWTMALLIIGIIAYYEWKRLPDERRWHGFKVSEAFSGLPKFISLAIASLGQVAIEWCAQHLHSSLPVTGRVISFVVTIVPSRQFSSCYCRWAFEFLIVSSGWVSKNPDVSVSASAIAYSLISFVFSIWLGISQATSSRTGNFLGSGEHSYARLAAYAGMFVSGSLGVLWTILSFSISKQLALLFAREEEDNLLEAFASIMPFALALQVGDSVQANAAGTLRGQGRQGLASVLNLISYWVVGVGSAAALAVGADLKLRGLWVGVLIANAVQCIFLVTTVVRSDWRLQAENAVALQAADTGGDKADEEAAQADASKSELSSLLHEETHPD